MGLQIFPVPVDPQNVWKVAGEDVCGNPWGKFEGVEEFEKFERFEV